MSGATFCTPSQAQLPGYNTAMVEAPNSPDGQKPHSRRELLKIAGAATLGSVIGFEAHDPLLDAMRPRPAGQDIGSGDVIPEESQVQIEEHPIPYDERSERVSIQDGLPELLKTLSPQVTFNEKTGDLRIVGSDGNVITERGMESTGFGTDGKRAMAEHVYVAQNRGSIIFSYALPGGDSEYVEVYRNPFTTEWDVATGAYSHSRTRQGPQ